MFIMSMKMSKKKIAIIITTIIFVIAGLLVGIKCLSNNSNSDKVLNNSESLSDCIEFKTEKDIKKYIKSFGWEIEEKPSEVVNVKVPTEFNDVYKNYNKIQKEQGFDLSKYKGKNAKRITFVVLNYPDMPKNIRADIITYDNKIIASDICSVELDGFMYGMDSFPKVKK